MCKRPQLKETNSIDTCGLLGAPEETSKRTSFQSVHQNAHEKLRDHYRTSHLDSDEMRVHYVGLFYPPESVRTQ